MTALTPEATTMQRDHEGAASGREQEARQRVFDTAVRVIFAQGGPAYKGYCLYRADDGRRCAVGANIPDALYSEAFEGQTVDMLPEDVLDAILPGNRTGFLAELQGCHDAAADEHIEDDGGFLKDVAERFHSFAEKQGLSRIVLNEVAGA